jgi:dienelactone hydrolase
MTYTDQTKDIRAAISFLAGEPTVEAQRIGIMGSSYGGGLVTYMAGTDPRVKCVVAQASSKASPTTASTAEAFQEATALDLAWFEEHLKGAGGERERLKDRVLT